MKPGWRWAGVGVVILFAALAVSAWNKQGFAPQPETTKPGTGTSPSSATGPSAAKAAPAAVGSPRDRPGRDRADRP